MLDCFVPCKCSAFDVVNEAKRLQTLNSKLTIDSKL